MMLFGRKKTPAASPKPLVVIVDDERDLCLLLQLALKPHGYDVELAHDGQSGLELIRSRRPALALIDIQMPRVNGLQLLAQMQQDAELAKIPVIVMTSLTGESDKTDQEWAASMNVSLLISKPMDPETVVQAVQRLVPIAAPDA